MDLSSLRTQQLSLAASVERGDRLDQDPPTLIGGADVGFEQEGEVTRAAMVLLSYPSLELVEYQVARVATTMPYIPGFLSFRETPRCWQPGSSFRRSQISYLLMATVFPTRAASASPAILVCWWMCRLSAWRKNGCAVSSSRWAMSPARWRRC